MGQNIDDVIQSIQANKEKLGIILNKGASIFEIENFEQSMKLKLPGDLRAFYEFSNGFYSEEDMFNIIPLHEIMDQRFEFKVLRPNGFDFAEYMTYCDMWTISIDDEGDKYSIYNIAETEIVLTDSVSEFLEVFLNGGVFDGLNSWRQRVEKNQK
jgi:hypothetical protein